MKITSEMYYRLHEVCPSCGSRCIETTLKGTIINDLSDEDTNVAHCCRIDEEGKPQDGCGWEGVVHDLIPSIENFQFSGLIHALEKTRLLSTGKVESLSPAAQASLVLAEEINNITGLLLGYVTGKHLDTEPIITYLTYRGLLVKDDQGVRLA